MENNQKEGIFIANPTELTDRLAIAETCVNRLGLTVPVLVDGMDNAVERAFNGWPERLYVISNEGQIVYKGGRGPYGFKPDELEGFLDRYRA